MINLCVIENSIELAIKYSDFSNEEIPLIETDTNIFNEPETIDRSFQLYMP